jgi:hypothetical protein
MATKIVAVCGFSSNVGKTTLACELLGARCASWARGDADRELIESLPVYTRDDLPRLVALINEVCVEEVNA